MQSTSGRHFWRESRRHVTLFSSSFLDERSSESDENGGIRRGELFCKYEHVFKCTFSTGKTGPRPSSAGTVHVKIQTRKLVQLFRFEIWVNPISFFWGGGGGECRRQTLFQFEVT